MSAVQKSTRSVVRILLMAVILCNAVMPTAALAQPIEIKNGDNQDQTSAKKQNTIPHILTDLPPVTISSIYYTDTDRTTLTQNASGQTLYVSSSSGFAAGDEVLVMAMKGTQAGQYETAYVGSVFSDRLELTGDLVSAYDTTAGPVMVQKIPHLGAVTVASGGNITAHPWDGATGGVVFFRAESVLVQSGGKISVSGLGYRGGSNARTYAFQGESYPGMGSTSMEANGGGGGAGRQQFGNSGGGGGGGYGTNGANGGSDRGINYGRGGVAYGTANLDRLYLGSGGGGGAGYNSASCGAPGGAGGGALIILAESITVAGGMEANGNNGGNSPCDGGGGGGGSGGSIYLSATNLVLNANTVRALGGAAGRPDRGSWGGGAGGIGRIRLDYSFLSGTTNPPPGYTQTVSPLTSQVTASPTSVPADGTTPSTITVTAYDAYDNPVSGANVVLHTTGSAVLTQPSSPTNSQGKTTGQVTNTVGESVTISATVNGMDLQGTATVNFTGADLSLSLSGPTTIVAGYPIQYTLSVKNSSAMTAKDVSLEMTLPGSVSYSGTNSTVEPTQNGQTLTWEFGDFNPGGGMTFIVYGQVSSSAAVGTNLTAQAVVATETYETNTSNNTASRVTQVIDGYDFEVKIAPASRNLGIGASGVFTITVKNTGAIADTFNISVTGMDAGLYSLAQNEVALSPGGSADIQLTVQTHDCSAVGRVPFDVNVTGAAQNEAKSVSAAVDFQTAPIISNLQPQAGLLLGSRDVAISWTTDVQASGLLTVYPQGQPGNPLTFPTAAGLSHSAVVPNLVRNTTYEWFVKVDSSCGSAASTPQQFQISNGVVFKSHEQTYTINRDYDQTVMVQVVNQDIVPHEVHLVIEHPEPPYEDLTVNFRGSGSIDETVTVLPGETRAVELAFFAQDTRSKTYDLSAVLTSSDGTDTITDRAVIHAKVLFEADYTVEKVASNPVLNTATYRVTNLGQTITDLKVRAVDPLTDQPASVFITPQVYHARLGTGESLEFTVTPIYGAEDMANLPPNFASGGVLARLRKIDEGNFDLITEVGDKIQRYQAQQNCDGGRSVYPVTFTNVAVPLTFRSWYCPNRENIYIEICMPPFANSGNISGASLNLGIDPTRKPEPYDVDISMNGVPVGQVNDTILEGNYRFPIPVESLKTGMGGCVTNVIHIHADFPNFSHYKVWANGELLISFSDLTLHICANSSEEARQIAQDTYGFITLPDTLNVQIEAPIQGSTVGLDSIGMINVRALVGDNLSSYKNLYSVEAEVEYLDQPLAPGEKFMLFDDGIASHADGAANDRYFNANWMPRYSGSVRLTITATAPQDLTDTDQVTFTVNAQPDFEVSDVFIKKITRKNEAVEVFAELRNNGFSVDGPVQVEFKYYNTNDEGKKFGSPIHTTQMELFGTIFNGVFDHDEVVTIKDNQFVAPQVAVYYVEVIVDP